MSGVAFSSCVRSTSGLEALEMIFPATEGFALCSRKRWTVSQQLRYCVLQARALDAQRTAARPEQPDATDSPAGE